MIKEENCIPLTFFRDSIVSKNSLGNELKLPNGYGKEHFNKKNDRHKQGLHIQAHL